MGSREVAGAEARSEKWELPLSSHTLARDTHHKHPDFFNCRRECGTRDQKTAFLILACIESGSSFILAELLTWTACSITTTLKWSFKSLKMFVAKNYDSVTVNDKIRITFYLCPISVIYKSAIAETALHLVCVCLGRRWLCFQTIASDLLVYSNVLLGYITELHFQNLVLIPIFNNTMPLYMKGCIDTRLS